MNLFLATLIILTLTVYNLVKSLILFFVPRAFRSKKCIKGQRVLITGAGNGLGRELAIEFSKHSVCLILVDIDKESLLQTEKLLDRSSTAFVYDCDVSDHRKVYEMAKIVQSEAGDVDILVNNAGIMSRNYLLEIEEEKVVKTMGVNVLAHFWMCKAFLPAMMAKNEGHIVSVASLASKVCMPGLSDYCTSKFAAVGFAESLAVELRSKKLDGIKITIVCPSQMGTEMFQGLKLPPLFYLTPEYVAREVVTNVLLDEELLILPYIFKYAISLMDVVPRWLRIKSLELSGVVKGFEDFKGRTDYKNGTRGKLKIK